MISGWTWSSGRPRGRHCGADVGAVGGLACGHAVVGQLAGDLVAMELSDDDHRRGLQGDDFERLGHLMQRLGWIAFDPRERNFELAAQLCDIALGLYA